MEKNKNSCTPPKEVNKSMVKFQNEKKMPTFHRPTQPPSKK